MIASGLNHSITSEACFSPELMNDKKLFNKRKGEFT
jgi:hypothetical protein